MNTINLSVGLPTPEIEGFLQHVRGWQMHNACADVSIEIETTDLDSRALGALLDRVEPGFAYRTIISTPEGRHLRTTLRG